MNSLHQNSMVLGRWSNLTFYESISSENTWWVIDDHTNDSSFDNFRSLRRTIQQSREIKTLRVELLPHYNEIQDWMFRIIFLAHHPFKHFFSADRKTKPFLLSTAVHINWNDMPHHIFVCLFEECRTVWFHKYTPISSNSMCEPKCTGLNASNCV